MANSRAPESKRHSGSTILWTVLKISLALTLTFVALSYTDSANLVALLNRISGAWLAVSFLSFYGIAWFTAQRYWLLIGRQISFHDTFQMVLVQILVGNFVATGAGAASYVALLRGQHQIAITRALASLILARLGDGLFLIVSLAISTWSVWSSIAPVHRVILALLMLTALGGFVIVLAIVLRRRLSSLLKRSIAKLGLTRLAWPRRLEQIVHDVTNLDWAQAKRAIGPFAIYTVEIWGLMTLFAYSLVHTFEVAIGPMSVLFILSFTQILMLIPIQILGGLGVLDVTNLYFYGLFGFNQNDMAAVIVGTRILFYLANLVLLGRLLMMKGRPKRPDQERTQPAD